MDEVPLPDGPGRLWLAGKHFVGPDPEAALAASGADVVVCLCERSELWARYPDYVSWLDRNEGDRALWHPVPDLHAPTTEDAGALVDRLRAWVHAGRGILLHCGAGIGRAGTVAAALLIRMHVRHDEALAVVATARPTAGPEAGAQSELLAALAKAMAAPT